MEPLLLLVGAVSVLIGRRQGAGSVVSLVGCIILTLTVGYETAAMLRDAADPLIAKPPFGLYGLSVFLTLLADAGALHLYRLGRTARVSC